MPFEHYVTAGESGCGAAIPPAPAPPWQLLRQPGCCSPAAPRRRCPCAPQGMGRGGSGGGPPSGGGAACCCVVQDGGDDVDATHGLPICARVESAAGEALLLRGGPGVGRVTRPGLDQPVGEWAINRVPGR